MFNRPILNQLFHIKSDNPQTVFRGRQLQIYICILISVSIIRFVLEQIGLNIPALPLKTGESLTLLITLLGLFTLIRRGHVWLVTHLLFLSINAITLYIMIDQRAGFLTVSPYMLLISIVIVSFLDSIRASILYAIIFIGAMIVYLPIVGQPLAPFLILSITLVGTVWVVTYNLEKNYRYSAKLADDLQKDAVALQHRMKQLRLSAEVGQVASSSLNLDELMHETVDLIRNQFGFYHAALFLLDNSGRYGIVRESTGKVGEILKSKPHRLAVGSDSIVGQVLATRNPHVSSNINEDAVHAANALLPETRSEIGLPLISHGDLLGALDVQSTELNAFQEDDIAILQLMAGQVASAIYNARLFAQTQTRLNETKALFDMISILTATLDVGEIYRRAAKTFTEHLNITRCAVSSWDWDADTITTRAEFVHNFQGDIINRYDYEILEEIYPRAELEGTSHILSTQEPLMRYVDDPQLEEVERDILLRLGHTVSLEVPMVSGGRAYGVVEIYRDSQQPVFSEKEISFAATLASQVAIALHNAILATEAQSRAVQLSTLNRVGLAFSEATTLSSLYTNSRRELLSLTQATGISVFLVLPSRPVLQWVYGYEYGQEVAVGNTAISLERGLSGHVARTRQPLLVHEDMAEASEKYDSARIGAAAQAWLGVPLIVADEFVGVLAIESGDDQDAFSERDVQLVSTIGSSLAVAINNIRQLEEIKASQLATERLYQVGRQINTAQNVYEVVNALAGADMLAAAEKITINLFDEPWGYTRPGTLSIAATWQRTETTLLPPPQITLDRLPYLDLLNREQPVIVENVLHLEQLDRDAYQTFVENDQLTYLALFPLLVSGIWIGFVSLYADEGYHLNRQEKQQAQGLIRQAAAFLQTQRLLEQTQEALFLQSQQSLQLQTATEVSAVANSVLNATELMQSAVDLMQQRFNMYYVGILLVEPKSGVAVLRAATGEVGRRQIAEGSHVAAGAQSLINLAIEQGQLQLSQEAQKDSRWLPEPALPHTKSELVLPLKVKGRTIGALTVQSAATHDFTPALVNILQTIAGQLATAIANAQLLEQTEARARKQQVLNEVSTRLHRTADVNAIVGIGLQALSDYLSGADVQLQLGQPVARNGED